jgi:hypothetical protein
MHCVIKPCYKTVENLVIFFLDPGSPLGEVMSMAGRPGIGRVKLLPL